MGKELARTEAVINAHAPSRWADSDRLDRPSYEVLTVFDGLRAVLRRDSSAYPLASRHGGRMKFRRERPGWPAILTIEPPCDFQCTQSEGDWSVVLDIDDRLLRGELEARVGKAMASFLLPPSLRSILHAISSSGDRGTLRDRYLVSKCSELFCESLRLLQLGELVSTHPSSVLSADDTHRLMAALRFIETHACERPSLEAIARECGFNRSKLTVGFRATFGITVDHFAAKMRFAKATMLLLTSKLSVQQIAFEVGYGSPASFTRAFRKHFRIGPQRYRECGGNIVAPAPNPG